MRMAALAIVLVMIAGAPCFAEGQTQLEQQQDIYREEGAVIHDAVNNEVTKMEKYSEAMLTPIRVVKEATNQAVNPRMELLYDDRADDLKYGGSGPKFRMQF